jgi:hypothetical protein
MRPPFRLSVKSATKRKSTHTGAFVAFAHAKVNFEECGAFLGAPQTDHEICINIGGALFAPLGLLCYLAKAKLLRPPQANFKVAFHHAVVAALRPKNSHLGSFCPSYRNLDKP